LLAFGVCSSGNDGLVPLIDAWLCGVPAYGNQPDVFALLAATDTITTNNRMSVSPSVRIGMACLELNRQKMAADQMQPFGAPQDTALFFL
jgi:hypothetical protein